MRANARTGIEHNRPIAKPLMGPVWNSMRFYCRLAVVRNCSDALGCDRSWQDLCIAGNGGCGASVNRCLKQPLLPWVQVTDFVFENLNYNQAQFAASATIAHKGKPSSTILRSATVSATRKRPTSDKSKKLQTFTAARGLYYLTEKAI